MSSPAHRALDASDSPAGFDFTAHARRLCEDMVARLDELRHIDMGRVAVSFRQARTSAPGGMYASLTPLRFAGGQCHVVRRGQKWTIQRVCEGGCEMLYILNFYLPRFLDLPLDEKLTTVVHELWHVGPRFDGDLRRFGGRCYAHSGSQRKYDAHVRQLVDRWLSGSPPQSLYDFLRLPYRELAARHGRVYGRKIRPPKLVLVDG
jgi:hypothetical protein